MNLLKTYPRFLGVVGQAPSLSGGGHERECSRPTGDSNQTGWKPVPLICGLRFLLLALLLLSGLFALPARAADDHAVQFEYKVKAGYLFNFAKYVEWPTNSLPETNSPIVIGVMDGTGALPVIQQVLSNKMAGDRPVIVKAVTTPEAMSGCHILFVCRSVKTTPHDVMAVLGGTPTLVVGESELFAERGGMIGFYPEDERLRFTLNLESVARANLKVSAKVASVARVVKSQKENAR